MFWLGWSGVQVCSGAFYCILDFLWLFQKGRPLPRPESYSHPTLGSELSQETHVLTKQETLLDRIAGQRARGWGNPGSLLCYVTQSLGLYGDRINLLVVSRQSFWLKGLSWWLIHCSAKMDTTEKVVGHVVFLLDLSQTLLVGGYLLILCSLPGPPVINSCHELPCITHANGYYGAWSGWEISVSFP